MTSYLYDSLWQDEGLVHGFTGAERDFSTHSFELHAKELCRELGAQALIVPTQIHSNDVIVLSNKDISRLSFSQIIGEADAMIFPLAGDLPLIFGVRTADCGPLLVRGESHGAVIHAGWRGLANGIIPKTLSLLRELESDAREKLQVVIGPCASGERYQVGPEVIEQIGASAQYHDLGGKGLYLDVADTAARQVRDSDEHATVRSVGPCTIESESFHSYRRQGERKGLNLAFLLSGRNLNCL